METFRECFKTSTALNRHSPLSMRGGEWLHNRVVVPPMASGTANARGDVTARTISHYTALTRSRAALVLVEYSYVHRSGRSEESQLGIHEDAQIPGLRALAAAIHGGGARAGIQLTHAGGKTSREFTGGALRAPSRIRIPVKDRELELPDAMSRTEMRGWRDAFRSAVRRAAEAGFDLVEFHAAHGYGLNQWLSPVTNRRSDEYGGSLARNARLLFEIIEETRALHPSLLVAVRLPGRDFTEGGLRIEDSIWIARELERRGVDLLDVSSGLGGWRRPQDRADQGQGYLVPEAERIQASVTIPVIGVGGIEDGAFIDEAIGTRRISLAAVGRAILGDPERWGAMHLPEAAPARFPQPFRLFPVKKAAQAKRCRGLRPAGP